jgi:hypothetical protein
VSHSGHHSPESTGPSQGPVVLDIGGDVGAAVVHAPAQLDGTEIEIRRLPRTWDGTHVAVRRRPSGDEPRFAAVFGQLAAGQYEVRRRGGTDPVVRSFRVVGGVVTECAWPRVPSADPAEPGHNPGQTKKGARQC